MFGFLKEYDQFFLVIVIASENVLFQLPRWPRKINLLIVIAQKNLLIVIASNINLLIVIAHGDPDVPTNGNVIKSRTNERIQY